MEADVAGKVWVITGFENSASVYDHRLPIDSLSEAEVLTLLQRLASRHLTPKEIISASLRRDAQGYSSLLEPMPDHGGRYSVAVGNVCRYTASVEDDRDAEGT
jgi:hypothetical protein